MNIKTLIIAAVIVVVAVGGYLYMSPETEVTPATPAASTTQPAK